MGVIGVIVSHILNKELNYQTLWDRKYKICVENGEEPELDKILYKERERILFEKELEWKYGVQIGKY